MSYEVAITKRAEKKLSKISPQYNQKIRQAINNLSLNPRPVGCISLKGREGYRIRVGVYRIIYTVSDQKLTILVIDVGHRQDVYR
ncbi:MAG: type II toxin-antitoxin system RelE/ParE family toxin [Cyanobacteria bacterium J06621_8]